MNQRITSIFEVLFIKKHIFLILAFLTLGLACVFYLVRDKSSLSATEDKYLFGVQSKIQDEVLESSKDLMAVQDLLTKSADTSFYHLKIQTSHPYFIFKNGQLLFWSDYHFVPAYNQIAGNYSIKGFDWSEGLFLVNRRSFTTGMGAIEIFSFINLYRQYESEYVHLKSGFNPRVFSIDPQKIDISQAAASHLNMYSASKEFLFSVVPPKPGLLKNEALPINVIWLALFSMTFLIIYFSGWVWFLNSKRKYEEAFILLVSYLTILRAGMLYNTIPFIFTESNLFNPKFYAASIVSPSLGDLMLNLVFVLIALIYLVNHFFMMKSYNGLFKLPKAFQAIISTGIVIASYITFQWSYSQLINIYVKSQYILDLSLSIDFWERPLKIYSLTTFILISLIFFLANHFLTNIFIKLNRSKALGLGLFAFGSLLSFIFFYFFYPDTINVFALNAVYFLLIYLFKFPRLLYKFRYQTSIYFFIGALFCTALATYVVYNQAIRRDFTQKQQVGRKYLAENDEIGEFLLSKINTQIKSDSLIANILQSDFLPREQIQNRIKREYLGNYFDYYDIEISAFDASGVSLDNLTSSLNYQNFEEKYRDPVFKTSNADLFFINEPGNSFLKEYIDFIKISRKSGKILGYVILNLKLRDSNSSGELSGGDPQLSQFGVSEYSYAVYQNGRIKTIGGEGFNYERKIPIAQVYNPLLYEKGIILSGFKHVGVEGKNGRKIIVSSPELSPSSIYSNFSFLFLILVITIIAIVLMYAVRYGYSKMNVNFATKIQIFLNLAFLLPLILVVAITVTIIGSKLSESQQQSFLSQTENVSISFLPALDRYSKGKMSRQYLSDTLKTIANKSEKDISVFDTTGRLLVSNKLFSYETGVLSTFLNQDAYISIIEEKERKKTLPEMLGNLKFTTSYIGMKSTEGKLMGVISVPFYNAKASFEKEVVAVVGSMLNTFTSIFLILMVVSYFASNVLTVPLRLITNKIKKINLEKPNDPLKWKSDDEIGVLINAYNQMLVKLEESKRALSESNMQSAWQEMAKQVAHEIKNPLTPMKLSLQLLQRKLSNENIGINPAVNKQFASLIEQIDNISYIANSFSDFAKMPVPKNERFDFSQVVTKVVNLYAENRNITMKAEISPREVWVRGDRQLTGSIVSNLIINAIQAVSKDVRPVIRIGLEKGPESVTFSISDNGMGISPEIRNKIFLLNFSTKEGGSGVGLALAKRVIDHANGSIWFESDAGSGTTFFLSLPLA
ncbi:HAMP domain-containing protein [Pseudarcicella hirudinis]|uniref:histidine kinase n=1 Tax=Pseudarcicella hirudinis TaxID=1079859 RepID=A0A1I5PG77_9BACT|nr:HAMP domain-containing sensor histidine kinase [Pseudarcicella hirudinis]SFP32820.1 HAMP domain-containing protein [Pseudarcicella hirudinis]